MVAASEQAARAEWAASLSFMEYACAPLDLVKAFEGVPHDWLVRQAAKCQYPMKVLRLSIAAYKLGRVLICGCVCSSALVAMRVITAGSVLATIELRALLIQFMDEAVARFFLVDLSVYVDAVGLEAAGGF